MDATTDIAKTPRSIDSSLPDPREFPEADVVIYDGDCVFCTSQVQRLQRFDRRHRLAFISLHDPYVATSFPDLSHDALMEQMYVIDAKQRRHGGAAAFRYLTRRLPRLWLLAPILHIPFSLPLWQWAYRIVAKRRYQLAGKHACDGDACKVHFGD